MIIEMRTYTIRLGAMPEFLAMYACEGRGIQLEHLGEPVAYATAETGELSQVVHLWRYRDAADRDTRRRALEADPRWSAYRQRSMERSHVVRQTSTLLRAVDFAAIAPQVAAVA